jgi:hypothetical protein
MLDKENDSLKLVEFNTIAAALTSLSNKVFEVQSQILDKYTEDLIPSYSYRDRKEDGYGKSQGRSIGQAFRNGL